MDCLISWPANLEEVEREDRGALNEELGLPALSMEPGQAVMLPLSGGRPESEVQIPPLAPESLKKKNGLI